MTINEYPKKAKITTPEIAADILRKILKSEEKIDQDKEHFWSIGLNSQNQIQYIELVGLGILGSVQTHPREVFRMAVIKGVAQIITAHNHPSGETEPSEGDRVFIQRLVKAGEIIGIKMIDHVIITLYRGNYTSMKENKDIG